MKNIFVNRKNRILSLGILLVSIITLGIFVQGCNSDDSIFSNTITVNSQQANLMASEYVELVDNQYVLNLSEGKALALGISEFDYDRMQTEIREVNAFIIECQAKGIDVDINEPKKVDPNIQKVRLKSENGTENANSSGENSNGGNSLGTSNSSSNSSFACSFGMPANGIPGSASASVPYGVTKVKITFSTTCFGGICSGTVKCGGVSTSYSLSGISGGSTTVNLPMSNTNMTITGNTNCTVGGNISVHFIF
jgi:hypothetical protein